MCPRIVGRWCFPWPDLPGLISLAICGVAKRANPHTCRLARAEARRWASTQEDSYERACSRGANPFLASLTRVWFVKCDLALMHIFPDMALYFAPHSPEGGGRHGTKIIEVCWVRASRLARVALRSVGGLCNGGRQQQSPPLPTTILLQYQVSCGRKLVCRPWILIETTLF